MAMSTPRWSRYRTGDCCCITPCFCKRGSWTPGRPRCRGERPQSKATPLPLLRLIVLCSAIFVNQFGINMIFPFLPFMVHDFFPYLDKTELGHKAGFLGSAYFVGNFVGSFLWGWVSDKLGRRPILLFGVLATVATELLFGFSQNFVWAILARLLWGLLNGNIGVAKTYISEICDDTNQAKGFAVIGTCGGVARLLGAMVGGFLAQPASKYSALQFEFFCEYPYSLPCIVGGSLGMISFIIAWLFLDETVIKDKKSIASSKNEAAHGGDDSPDETNVSDNSSDPPCSTDSGIELPLTTPSDHEAKQDNSDLTDYLDEVGDNESALETDLDDVGSDTELIRTERERSNISKCLYDYRKRCQETFSFTKLAHIIRKRVTDCTGGIVACALCFWTFDCAMLKPKNLRNKTSGHGQAFLQGLLRVVKLLFDRKVFLSISLYGAIAFLAILSNELLPLLLVTGHEHGGYDMDDSEIGIVLMTAAIFQLVFQFFVFPQIVKCIGYRHTYKLGCVLFAIFVVLLPLSNRISGPISSSDDMASGSGSGNGSGLELVDNSTDYCGTPLYPSDNVTDTSINVDSVSRVPSRVWAVLLTITVVIVFSRMITITSVMVLIGNSTVPATRGTVNGFGQSTAALGRMIGPIAGAPLFAWSETSGKGWPLNYHLTFDLIAVGAVGAIMLCLLLPPSIEKKRDSPTTETAVIATEAELEPNPSSSSSDKLADKAV